MFCSWNGLSDVKAGFDVLGLGCVAVDELLYVAEFPAADAKTQVLRRARQCGGLTATALVAAARLGARCAYAGVLGEDELSGFVLERFQREGIDISQVVHRAGARPAVSTIVVSEQNGSRNIFFDLTGSVGAAEDAPPEAIVQASRVLLVDHFGIAGMLRAARLARQAGIPVVADFERKELPRFSELLALVNHLVLSRGFATQLTGQRQAACAIKALESPERETVIITCGEEGSYYSGARGPVVRQPAFSVKAVDTTGCGDVFHGAYAAALARGLSLPERVRFAAAAAALKATKPGGQEGIPDRATVESFLRERQNEATRET
jgi:sugar/nucleoside kinase (ribokinase family)